MNVGKDFIDEAVKLHGYIMEDIRQESVAEQLVQVIDGMITPIASKMEAYNNKAIQSFEKKFKKLDLGITFEKYQDMP